MRLCIFASIFELQPLVHSSERALLLKVRITPERKQLAYIGQETTSRACHLERQFRLSSGVASRRGGRGRGRRAHKTPADARGVPRILTDHDLGGAAGGRGTGPGNDALCVSPLLARAPGAARARWGAT